MLRKVQQASLRSALIAVLFLGIYACSGDGEEVSAEQTELEFYQSASKSLSGSNYELAVSKLQQLEARFPFGRYAEQAQLEIIYAYYKSLQPEAARNAADRFIRLHPQHPNVDYAYYLRGLASFEEDASFLDRFLPTDPTKRDPGAARQSFNDFAQLVTRFPESQYAPDAQKRMIQLRNVLAAYEINVARYYIHRGAYIAAANRGRYVLENFQQSPSVGDGLAVMVEAYINLNMNKLAEDALMVLVTNHPDHQSLDASGNFKLDRSVKNSEKSWLNIVSFGLFG
jgi:outer membrane protein assembly factor BamD